MSTIKRKKIVHQPETYARWYDEVKTLHNFSFRKRKKFTSAQKAAITRKHREHRETLKNLSKDKGAFKKLTKAQIRALKRGEIEREGFKITNKGIYVPGVRTDKIKAGRQKVIIKGKGKQTKIRIQLPARREDYFPYIEADWENFQEFVRYLIKKYKPQDLFIQNESGRGEDRYNPSTFMLYIKDDVLPRIKTFKKKYGIDRTPFVGVWLIWYKFK